MYPSETSQWRHLVVQYCQGNGLDLGAAGDPIVPSAISIDLPLPYAQCGTAPIHWRGDARDLYWLADNCLDYLYSSHLLEDFLDWTPVLKEWRRVVKPGGYVVLLIPDKDLYPGGNAAHQHEGKPGELSGYFTGWEIVCDKLADPEKRNYNIVFVARKR